MEKKTFALKGNIIFTKEREHFEIIKQGYLICENGKVREVCPVLPETFRGIPVERIWGIV